MDDHPLGFGDVKGRAGRIQRNRRLAAGAAVAAAVAIITPVAMLASQGLVAEGDKVDPAIPAPREMISTTLTLDGLERGDAPAIEYFIEDGVVLPGEGLQPLDQSYQALVEAPGIDGWYALSPSKDTLLQLDQDLAERGTGLGVTQTLVSNPDRTSVAYTTPAGMVLQSTTESDVSLNWSFPEFPVVDPVDFTGPDSLVFQTTTPEGQHEIGLADADGTTTSLPGFVKAISASPATGDVAVQTRSKKDASGCFGVVDPAASLTEPVWETCDYSLGAFSPDGQHVLASDPYLSGQGITSLAVLDAGTGATVTRFTQASNTQIALMGVAWESADSVVAVAQEGVGNTVLRFTMDGTIEQATDTIDVSDPSSDTAFYLGQDRRRGW